MNEKIKCMFVLKGCMYLDLHDPHCKRWLVRIYYVNEYFYYLPVKILGVVKHAPGQPPAWSSIGVYSLLLE